ncbi:hypothetical protein V5799_031350 [Amblyomma americanum]|uniref:C2H2-type domain-containing protein n=1 Tax=Amblyomma americanum TaxID=6943 RepID=A0AAQ4EKM4_AMBAM
MATEDATSKQPTREAPTRKLLDRVKCGYRWDTPSLLEVHRRRHHPRRLRYPRRFCEYSRHRRSDITKHQMVHTREKPHKCLDCDGASHNLPACRATVNTGKLLAPHVRRFCVLIASRNFST